MSARFGVGLVSVGVFVALALGWLFGDASSLPSALEAGSGSSSQPVTQEALARELSALRSQLKVESSARRKLANQLAQLRSDLETSGALVPDVEGRLRPVWDGDLSAAADEEEADPLLEQGEDDEQEEVADAASIEDPASEKPGFDSAALVASGLHPQEVEELRERWEEFWLDHLYMVDQAKREGWRHKPRYWREASILERELLDELGEESFDRLLYASGRPNRVIIRDVLQGSSGHRAGLRPGDTILRYNDRPVYDTRKLQAATSRGKLGRSVRIEVLRDGELFTLDIDRGPLGTVLRADSAEPLSR